MGVGIGIRSKSLSETTCLALIQSLLKESSSAFGDPDLDKRIKTFEQQGRGWIRFFNAEEDVELFVDDGRLVCFAKTSSLGPGYHAFLVDWLKRMDQKLNLDWNWSEPDGDYGDVTGYAVHNKFEDVQHEMLIQLKSMADVIVENEDASHFKLNMPLEFPGIKVDHFAACPMGFLSHEWFKQICAGDLRLQAQLASQYYPWWNVERDASFWYRMGLLQMWSYVRWNVPLTGPELFAAKFALLCFERAKALDPALEFPVRELDELKTLLQRGSKEQIPNPSGIGFYRGNLSHNVGGSWTVQLPGYYHYDDEGDGSEHVFWFGNRTVRASVLSVRGQSNRRASPDEMLHLKPEEQARGQFFSKDHLRGWAEFKVDKDGNTQLSARVAAENTLCLLTICIDAGDGEWALNIWRNTNHPPPREE